MAPGLFEIVLILIVVFLLFGAGRVPGIMENFAKGIKSFKKGLRDEDDKPVIGKKED
jgi:sec-independent protein translocase protein TatA